MTYWQIAIPLLAMGVGLPFFFVPVTALALGCVEPDEVASAAGLQNFLRTLSGAVSTSLVTTMWDDRSAIVHADLAGMVDRGGEAMRALIASGNTREAATQILDRMLQGQSVMVATNQILWLVAALFVVSAVVICLAPRPSHAVDMTQAGH
jgi:DHA2 family multidrug resistance protein